MLATIRRLIKEYKKAPDFSTGLTIIARNLVDEMQVDVCSIYLKQSSTEDLVLMANIGLNPELVGLSVLKSDEGLVGMIAQRAEPLNLSNAFDHPNFSFVPQSGEEQYRGFLGVPLIRARETIGVLVIQSLAERQFLEEEVDFLTTAATFLSEIISLNEVFAFVQATKLGGKARMLSLLGVSGASGVALGTAHLLFSPTALETLPDRVIDDPDAEIALFRQAVAQAQQELFQLSERMKEVLPDKERQLFDVYIGMLENGSLIDDTIAKIKAGNWAPGALRETVVEHIGIFESMEDPYFRERASDIRDLGRRIQNYLQKGDVIRNRIPSNTILVGEDISAAQLAEFPAENIAGLISVKGSVTSHVAIMAKAMGIPAVLGVTDLPLGLVEGRRIIVDGFAGRVYVSPNRNVVREYNRLIREENELAGTLRTYRDLPAISPDGYEMALYVTTGLLTDLSHALENRCQGIGLHRSEFPFMTRDRFPGEAEQAAIYRKFLEPFVPYRVVLRTLDIGGDKDLPYFPIKESNPFLGWRGIRVTLDHPEIFATQLRAMLRANIGLGNLHIVFPMVSSIDELDDALRLLDRIRREMLEEGYAVEMPKVGVIIEVPSAVYQAEAIARRVDFMTVGTNDLTQYLVAVDRNNSRVAHLYDELHPAVLQALIQVVKAGERARKPVGVCGSMAGDPLAAILLFAMGFDHLSMSVVSLLKIKMLIRTLPRARAIDLLNKALTFENSADIRRLLVNCLEEMGLGSLYRAGK